MRSALVPEMVIFQRIAQFWQRTHYQIIADHFETNYALSRYLRLKNPTWLSRYSHKYSSSKNLIKIPIYTTCPRSTHKQNFSCNNSWLRCHCSTHACEKTRSRQYNINKSVMRYAKKAVWKTSTFIKRTVSNTRSRFLLLNNRKQMKVAIGTTQFQTAQILLLSIFIYFPIFL